VFVFLCMRACVCACVCVCLCLCCVVFAPVGDNPKVVINKVDIGSDRASCQPVSSGKKMQTWLGVSG
jgi:hypothetical protein